MSKEPEGWVDIAFAKFQKVWPSSEAMEQEVRTILPDRSVDQTLNTVAEVMDRRKNGKRKLNAHELDHLRAIERIADSKLLGQPVQQNDDAKTRAMIDAAVLAALKAHGVEPKNAPIVTAPPGPDTT